MLKFRSNVILFGEFDRIIRSVHGDEAAMLVKSGRAEPAEQDSRKHIRSIRLIVKTIPGHLLGVKPGSYGVTITRVPPGADSKSSAGLYYSHNDFLYDRFAVEKEAAA